MKRHLSFQTIRKRIASAPHGSAFVAGDFTDVASNAAANEALLRLLRLGDVRRVLHGVYEKPWYNDFLRETIKPEPDEIAKALARKFNWTIAPCGDAALNLLGLSSQVPTVWTYVSTGPYRTYEMEGATLRFKHAANKEFVSPLEKSNRVVQALKALGERCVDAASVAGFRRSLGKEDRERLLADSQYTTGWIRAAIQSICKESSTCVT